VISRARVAATAVALLAVASLAVASPAAAAPDRKAPTTPGNFRVTSATPYFAHLAWNPSTDNSGTVRYHITVSNGESVTLPNGTTTHSWFLVAGHRYTFTIRAIDPSGNRSASASTSVTLPQDRSAPSTPELSVTGTGATHVSLNWTAAVEDGPYAVKYTLFVDGSPIDVGTVTSYAVDELSPQTTHTFRVVARDFWQNVSPSSDTLTATTSALDPNDTTPPTMPGNLNTGGMVFQDGETWLFWIASTDNNSPASRISYRVLVNGVLDHVVRGHTRAILYVPVGQTNRIDVVAVDEAGNESAPATIFVTP
jgi:fibronectin type III domain protein